MVYDIYMVLYIYIYIYIYALQTIRFHRSYDVKMREIRITNSPQIHIHLLGCNDIELGYLHLQSPDVSPNTDGIHIQATNNVSIYNSYIGVGNFLFSLFSLR
jgi:polygalacturonase